MQRSRADHRATPGSLTALRAVIHGAADLQQHVKSHLAPYKYPRWIGFVSELPKTATGKIQRFKPRAQR